MLKGIGFLIFGIGLILMISKFYKQYKKEKNIENMLVLIGIGLLCISSIFLGILEFITIK